MYGSPPSPWFLLVSSEIVSRWSCERIIQRMLESGQLGLVYFFVIKKSHFHTETVEKDGKIRQKSGKNNNNKKGGKKVEKMGFLGSHWLWSTDEFPLARATSLCIVVHFFLHRPAYTLGYVRPTTDTHRLIHGFIHRLLFTVTSDRLATGEEGKSVPSSQWQLQRFRTTRCQRRAAPCRITWQSRGRLVSFKDVAFPTLATERGSIKSQKKNIPVVHFRLDKDPNISMISFSFWHFK